MSLYARLASLPLRVKLVLGLFFSALALVALALFSIAQYSQAAQPISGVLMDALARERAALLDALVNNARTLLDGLEDEALVNDAYLALAANPQDSTALQTVEARFRTALSADPAIRQVRFVSSEGQILALMPRPAGFFSRDDTTREYYLTLQNIGKDDVLYAGRMVEIPEPAIDFATVFVRGGERKGFLVIVSDPSGSTAPGAPSFYNALRSYSSRAGLINFYLTAPDGRVESPLNEAIMSTDLTRQSAINLATQPFTQPRQYLSPVTNRMVHGFALFVPSINRAVVAETQQIAIGGENEIGQFVLQIGVLLGLTLLALGAIWVFFEATIISPMLHLAGMTNRAVQGRSIVEIEPLPQHDEIGTLVTSFNTLTQLTRQDIQALENRVAQRTRDVEATREIGQIISSLRDVDTVLNQIIELIRERFEDVYHAQVFLLDSTKQFAVLRASTGEVGTKLLARGHRLAVGSQSVIGRTTGDGQAVVALDTSTSAIHKANELLPETRAELALPLRTREGIIGALDLQSKRPEAFTDADIRLFQSVADELAIAIINAQLFEESRARLIEIEELNRRLLGEAWRGYSTVHQKSMMPAKSESEDWSELQQRAMQTRNLAERIEEDQVTFAVPVILRDQVFGAIEWVVPRANYNENTRLLARELSARLAITADNARLLEQSQRLVNRERLVNDIAAKLIQQTDVTQVLQIAVKELGLALRVPQTSIRLAANPDEKSYVR